MKPMNRATQIMIDVEATGACPGKFSLLQIGAVVLTGESEFFTTVRPLKTAQIDPQTMRAIGLTEEDISDYDWPPNAMESFDNWLCGISSDNGGARLTAWSDNPAFDWQFINYYLHDYLDANMLGFSMRRIGDLWAGYNGNPCDHTGWKGLRDTWHSHNALDGARGNAEALNKILDMIESR
jgi:hypothetical protein